MALKFFLSDLRKQQKELCLCVGNLGCFARALASGQQARFKFPACCGLKIARKNFEALIFGPFDLSKRTPNIYKICRKLLRINKFLKIKNNANLLY
ncbi:MAG: hypothetical protein IM600_10465 [Bacteroidetes bacterium]|nr:hypothetical protein [Bacteroidota bacterium]MCA6443840.1 hypothetical protein [Bacteroidota bacterium]